MADKLRYSFEDAGAFLLAEGPRWMTIFLICFAPFCYGLRDGAGEDFFAAVSFFAFFIFAWKCFLDGKWPRLPAWLLFCLAWILLQGFWMTLNANSHYRFHHDLVTVRFLELAPFPELPGSRTRFKSPDHFYPQVGVLCLMIIVINTPRSVRERYLQIMAGTAIVFALFGITTKLWGVEALKPIWGLKLDSQYISVFGTYRYHGNAGTYLAIGLALTFGAVLSAGFKHGRPRAILFTIGLPALMLAAALNTSRAGWALAIYVTGSALIAFVGGLLKSEAIRSRINMRQAASVGVAILLILTAAFVTFWADKEQKLKRLDLAAEQITTRYPLFLFQEMAKDTPMFGFGPGSFPMVFPKYQVQFQGHFPMHLWLNEAHQDYFQFFFDWGPVGAIPWMVLFFAPILSAIRRPTSEHPVSEPFQFMGIAALSAVLIHAVHDFPLQVTSLLFYFGLIAACLTVPAGNGVAGEKPAGL